MGQMDPHTRQGPSSWRSEAWMDTIPAKDLCQVSEARQSACQTVLAILVCFLLITILLRPGLHAEEHSKEFQLY